MNYVQRMRRIVGHAPLILVGANVLVLDGARRLLLQRRTERPHEATSRSASR